MSVNQRPEFVPSRLTAARKRSAATIAALSVESGISTKSLSEYENARKEPSTETINKLAEALEVWPEYFSRPPLDDVPLEAVSFRAPSKMPKRNKDMALMIASHSIELRSWIDRHYETPGVDVPTLHRHTGIAEGPAQAAAVVRARWGLGSAPVGNMVHLLEFHGTAVFSARTHKSGVLDAFSFWANGRPYVLLCTTKTPQRGRFDAAHELGHLVLHREVSGTGPELEREADEFASEFLMPEADVRAQVRMNPPLDQILKKKHRWGVAAVALAYRLHDLGLLSDWLYHTTYVNLSRMGYRSGEPNGGVDRESSRLLGLVMSDLLTTAGGFEGLCKDLAVEPSGVNDLVFNLAPLVFQGDRQTSQPVRPELRLVDGGATEFGGKKASGSKEHKLLARSITFKSAREHPGSKPLPGCSRLVSFGCSTLAEAEHVCT